MSGHGNGQNVGKITTNKVPVYYTRLRRNNTVRHSTYASIGLEQPGEKLLKEFLKRSRQFKVHTNQQVSKLWVEF